MDSLEAIIFPSSRAPADKGECYPRCGHCLAQPRLQNQNGRDERRKSPSRRHWGCHTRGILPPVHRGGPRGGDGNKPPPSSLARANHSQYQPESPRTLPYPAGLRTFPTRPAPAKRETKRALSAPPRWKGTLLSHPVATTPPAPPRASPRLEPLLSQPLQRSPYVSEISIRGLHPTYPDTLSPEGGTQLPTTGLYSGPPSPDSRLYEQ